MHKEAYVKTINIMPEESSVQVVLVTTNISMVFASINEENGYSFAIDGFYLRTASEDSLNWGANGESVKLKFYRSRTEDDYAAMAKTMSQELVFISEFLLHNFTHAGHIVCGGTVPDAPTASNSITIDSRADVVKVACFKNARHDATDFHILIMDSLEFQD